MSCKFLETSRSYKFCASCADKDFCVDSTAKTPLMPNVELPKTNEREMEKAIKLLIDNGYYVSK